MGSIRVRGLRVAALALSSLLAVGAAAQAASPQYRVSALPSLGGASSAGNGINDLGWVTGTSNLSGDTITRAALWRDGRVTDLGTLGGSNSAVVFPSHNDHFVSGVAETAQLNPAAEPFSCSVFFVGAATRHDCEGFVWQDGAMSPLPTLGGYDGFAAGSDRAGQIVGWAEDGIADPTCTGGQVQQFRAVIWSDRTHTPRALQPLGRDLDSAAVAVNDRRQVVGISGACGDAVGGVSARHAVLWDASGDVHYLGSLGGTQWNTPDAINDRGVVVGFANAATAPRDAQFYPHAFVWTSRSGMRDLGTLPGDVLSEAEGINDRGEIVGDSCGKDFTHCRAVIWIDGRIHGLNELVRGAPGTLTNAGDVNDRGQITGSADDGAGTVAYVATPVGG